MHSSNSPLLNEGPICSSTFRPNPRNAKWLKKQRPVDESCVQVRQMELLCETIVERQAFWHSSGERICKRMVVNGSRKPAWLIREKPQFEGSICSMEGERIWIHFFKYGMPGEQLDSNVSQSGSWRKYLRKPCTFWGDTRDSRHFLWAFE